MLFGLIYQRNDHLQMLPKFGKLRYIMIYLPMFFSGIANLKIFTWCNVIQHIKKVSTYFAKDSNSGRTLQDHLPNLQKAPHKFCRISQIRNGNTMLFFLKVTVTFDRTPVRPHLSLFVGLRYMIWRSTIGKKKSKSKSLKPDLIVFSWSNDYP